MIVALVMAPINIGLAVYVAREFGWLEFRIVGASEALQCMYITQMWGERALA